MIQVNDSIKHQPWIDSVPLVLYYYMAFVSITATYGMVLANIHVVLGQGLGDVSRFSLFPWVVVGLHLIWEQGLIWGKGMFLLFFIVGILFVSYHRRVWGTSRFYIYLSFRKGLEQRWTTIVTSALFSSLTVPYNTIESVSIRSPCSSSCLCKHSMESVEKSW